MGHPCLERVVMRNCPFSEVAGRRDTGTDFYGYIEHILRSVAPKPLHEGRDQDARRRETLKDLEDRSVMNGQVMSGFQYSWEVSGTSGSAFKAGVSVGVLSAASWTRVGHARRKNNERHRQSLLLEPTD